MKSSHGAPFMTMTVHSATRRGVLALLAAVVGVNFADANARRRRHRRLGFRHDRKTIAISQDIACDPDESSGIAGLVLIGPMCPVVTQDDPCPDRPYAATIVVRDAEGNEVCSAQSGEDGVFRVGLPPGQYELDPVNGPYGLPYAGSQTVEVEPGLYTEVLVSYDSGIR